MLHIQSSRDAAVGDDPASFSPRSIQVTDTFLERFNVLTHDEQLSHLSQCLSLHSKNFHNFTVPDDFLQFCLCAMKNLEAHGKTNVLYGISKGLGNLRPDGSDSLFPITRMPFGVLEYMVNFFNGTPGSNASLIL